MTAEPRSFVPLQDVEGMDGPFYFRATEFSADSLALPHSHSWGSLNYTAQGTMEMESQGQRFLSPPQHAVWVPPGVTHSGLVRDAVVYRSLYIGPELCGDLPADPCTIPVGPIVKSVFADFAVRDLHVPETEADLRPAQVVVDQVARSKSEGRFLPAARSPALAALLAALHEEPGSNRSMAEWAASVHMTERTLARLCHRELGMSFGDWRQRLRFLHAIDALDEGHSVQRIAFDLGYSTASAFISMFQRESGTTPDQYRRRR